MAEVSTNKVAFQVCKEASLGVLPGTPQWKKLQPNSIGTFGATITTVSRNPISAERQEQKGTITDLDSAVDFEHDLTGEVIHDFIEGFCFATATGGAVFGDYEGSNTITGVDGTAEEYDVGAGGALAENTLIFARGFTNSENNGLKEVATGSGATAIAVEEDLVDEVAPPKEARIEVCGFRTIAGDLDVTAVGATQVTLTLTEDLTGILTPGQQLYFGGALAINQFSNAENSGYARLVSITATTMVIDKTSQTWVTEANTTQLVDIYFGRFIRNVPVTDSDYLEQSFQFEATYPDLGGVGTDHYEYAKGNMCNQLTLNLPLADKATIGFAFVGTDTEPPSATRDTEAPNAMDLIQTTAFNTSADIGRLRITEIDEDGLSTCFKTCNLTINNNVSPEKCIGTLGASFMNIGNLNVTIDAQILFANSAVPAAIRNNTTVTMEFGLRNEDQGIWFDFPAVLLGDGAKEFPENETVRINTPATAVKDDTLGTSIGISLFPYLPSS